MMDVTMISSHRREKGVEGIMESMLAGEYVVGNLALGNGGKLLGEFAPLCSPVSSLS